MVSSPTKLYVTIALSILALFRAGHSLSSDGSYHDEPIEIIEVENVDACSAYFPEKNHVGFQDSEDGIEIVTLESSHSLAECEHFASSWRDDDGGESLSGGRRRCRTACWFGHQSQNSSKYIENGCFCIVNPIWMPKSTQAGNKVDSARLVWPCLDDSDCSFNGHCDPTGHRCHCSQGWKGPFCGQLDLLPVDKKRLGFRDMDANGHNVSTWGAPVLFDESSKRWHGYVSEMQAGCGINAWQTNSRIVHIVGDSPYGPFERQEVVFPVFAHEPSVVRGTRGEWVMLFSSYRYNATGLEAIICSTCKDGVTPEVSPKCPFQRGYPKNLSHVFQQMMSFADDPNGPWETPVEIPQLTQSWDWNTDLTIHPDGSAVALIRAGMTWHADTYWDPTTWHPVGDKNSGNGPRWAGVSMEDPYIWEENGVYHALAHAFSPFYGVHAYAMVPPSDFDDWRNQSLNWTVTGVAYDNNVRFTDGSSHSFPRRERPHLVWALASSGKKPVALSNGVQIAGKPSQTNVDGVFTLMQPINRGSSSFEKTMEIQ